MVKHVILWQLKDELSAEEKEKVYQSKYTGPFIIKCRPDA